MKFVRGFAGLGDNVYQRPFVRALLQTRRDFVFETPWPELYSDLGKIKFARPQIKWRTQNKNLERHQSKFWVSPPRKHDGAIILLQYGSAELQSGNIVQAFEKKIPLPGGHLNMDLPIFNEQLNEIPSDRRIAVIRPVTIRKEWPNVARAPKPEYLHQIALDLKARGYFVVSVADLKEDEEWLEGPIPPADLYYHQGELYVQKLITLIKRANVVVGGVGWIAPMCVAAKTPLFLVFGGNGAHNAPEKIFDPRMDLSKIETVLPTNFCKCSRHDHHCNKEIPDLMDRWNQFHQRILG